MLGANAPQSRNVIPWLDNMRLVAMIGVLSFHFWTNFHPQVHSLREMFATTTQTLALPLQLGWEADDLFFLVSGLGLALSLAGKKPDWLSFSLKRFKRIYVPYWVAVVAIFAYQGAAVAGGTWDRPFGGPFTQLDWVCNFLLLRQNDFNPFSSHFWFLYNLVELYVIFPALYWLINRFRALGLAGLLIFHSLWVHHPISTGPFSGASTVIFWMASFCIGVYVGINLGENRARTEMWLRRLLPLGVVMFAAGTVMTFRKPLDPFVHPLIGAGGLLIAYAICSLPWHLPKLTEISFETYLVHAPFLGWYRHFFGFVEDPKWAIYIFYMVTVALMGAAIHHVSNRLLAGAKAKSGARSSERLKSGGRRSVPNVK
ncbi:acyltransferase family protein [Paraburkholderia phenazinium]|uniref:Peptidoglycan/LPS O-acetylase OafA/YrhL, contains acyltransferase and SGNH-hydrolase domains n=1 Tax=Paraburkholderia phenazinium TaxID=60549 RepID=A0A1N6KPZ3_9BURK|nr:acyltransferase [Paraburkholderia phenazinium]SIO58446.1 Peptidoglycan/LPS O-acetylase OafA/YrhL, contains acyltransferase and SGNH-hydrolase domains [Paraburkholderia phenazinium]